MPHPQSTRSGLSIRVRVLIIVSAIITPAMLLLAFLNHAETKRYAERAAEEYGLVASTDFEEWVSRFKDTLDLVEFDAELGRRLAAWKQVREIAVFEFKDGDFRLLAHRGAGGGRDPVDVDFAAAIDGEPVTVKAAAAEGARYMVMSRPVKKDGDTMAVVRLRFSLASVDEALARSGDVMAIFSVAVIVVIGIALFLYLGRTVTDPVLSLMTAMREASHGERSTIGDVKGSAEIGWLASSFSRMITRIRKSEDKNSRLLALVGGMYDVLQEKVQEATAELERRNDDLKAAQERLFSAQRDAQRLERMASLGQLTAEIAHEIGTPLNAVSGHIQLLYRDAGLAPASKVRLRVVESEIDRLATIVRDFLKTLRPPEPVLAPTDLAALASDVIRITAPILESKGVTARVVPPGDVRAVVADQGQIEQVLLNLVVNAMDALPNGGTIELSLAAVSNPRDGREAVEVRITDDGGGIPEEKLKEIFQPFKSTKARGRGTGLGLSISREILRRHGGDIRAESVLGRGTTLAFWLPAAVASVSAEPEEERSRDDLNEGANPRART